MIELIVLDVDGTLTDGKIIYTSDGDEMKNFDVKDGLAVASWTKKFNKKAAIITGRKSRLLERRAKELGITHLYQGIEDKEGMLEHIMEKENLSWENVAVIGDDLNDYRMLKKAALSFAPNDAVKEIRELVNVVCQKNGGCGAVREMVEYILKYDQFEKDLLDLWI